MSYPTTKLKPEIKAEWVARLRSGTYPQAKQYLRTEHGYCCLGVLCVIAEEAGIVPPAVEHGSGVFGYVEEDDTVFPYTEVTVPPSAVIEWAFGVQEIPNIWGSGGESLTMLNDHGNGDNFNEIADEIEAHW